MKNFSNDIMINIRSGRRKKAKLLYTYPLVVELSPYIIEVKVYESIIPAYMYEFDNFYGFAMSGEPNFDMNKY